MFNIGDKVKSVVSGYYLDNEGVIKSVVSGENDNAIYSVELDNGEVITLESHQIIEA